jgi:DNA-binding MarR family transcriptional regulator
LLRNRVTLLAAADSAEPDISPAAAWERTLRTVSGLIKVFGRELEHEINIPLMWYDVLVHLSLAPEGKLHMQVLADSVLLQSSDKTRLVDRIENAGLVRRESVAEDRRGYYVVLTDEGRRVRERAQLIHRHAIENN